MKTPRVGLLLLLLLPGCATLGGGRDLSGTWTGEMTVDALAFPTTVQFRQEGTRLRGPAESPGLSAALEGEVSGGRVSFEGEYATQGCTGTLTGRGTVAEDGQTMSGALTVVDSCTGRAQGRFHLRRSGG